MKSHSFAFRYGDMYPTSDGGRAAATVLILLSVLILALPISVIGNNFSRAVEAYNNEKASRKQAKALLLKKINEGIVGHTPRFTSTANGSTSTPATSPKSLQAIHNKLIAKFEEYEKQLKVCEHLKTDFRTLLVQHGKALANSDGVLSGTQHVEDHDNTPSKNPMLNFDIE